ncbi:hypothetical protein [Nesterenkonia muleiensis]|uniref:hypothetical protein n=1 Tax=Nesterenkonia muleiensis TaxID=2282648 RepID=UPI000E733B36|nr:hypothetical protein [Nesterenkonia muleiensis]
MVKAHSTAGIEETSGIAWDDWVKLLDEAGASKAYAGDKDAALARWLEVVHDREEFGDVPLEEEPKTSFTEKGSSLNQGLLNLGIRGLDAVLLHSIY